MPALVTTDIQIRHQYTQFVFTLIHMSLQLFKNVIPDCINSMWSDTKHGTCSIIVHDDVIKWKHFPRYWPFVRGIHRSPVNFPHEGQWRGALMFSLICAWINCWANNGKAGDLRRHRAHYDVTVMTYTGWLNKSYQWPTIDIRITWCTSVVRRIQ